MCFCGVIAIFLVFIRFGSSDENALRIARTVHDSIPA